jgi:transposase
MHTATQPTIWEVPDDGWTMIEPLRNECYPAKPNGQRRVERRRVLHGSICRLRTGGPWTQLPKQCGDDSPVHRHCQQGCQRGSLARRWVVERTLAWLSKGRGLLVREEKKAVKFFGLLQLACALRWMRRRARLIGD